MKQIPTRNELNHACVYENNLLNAPSNKTTNIIWLIFSKYTILNTVIKYSCSNSGNSGKINNSEQNESETAKSVNITN